MSLNILKNSVSFCVLFWFWRFNWFPSGKYDSKISFWTCTAKLLNSVGVTYHSTNDGWFFNSTDVIFKLGEIISIYTTTNPRYDSITQLVSKNDYSKINRSKLTEPTKQYPLALTTQTTSTINNFTPPRLLLKISPKPDELKINCVFKPKNPQWGFTQGSLGQYLYNVGSSVDFELDVSEQTNLITNILKYAGVIIRDPEIIQTATQEAQQTSVNEKS